MNAMPVLFIDLMHVLHVRAVTAADCRHASNKELSRMFQILYVTPNNNNTIMGDSLSHLDGEQVR